jgi:hypothetical protein
MHHNKVGTNNNPDILLTFENERMFMINAKIKNKTHIKPNNGERK